MASEASHSCDGDVDERFDTLLSYCTSRKIFISPSLRPRYSPTSGLGLHAITRIKSGQQLIDAPPVSLLTVARIPSSFMPDKTVRESLTVHGLLAAWLAFGNEDALRAEFGPWMDVWPSWVSFRDSIPIFWDWELPATGSQDQLHQQTEVNEKTHPGKRRKVFIDRVSKVATSLTAVPTESSSFTLSPALSGQCLTIRPANHVAQETTGLLKSMREKIDRILAILSDHQEVLGLDVSSSSCRDQYIRFLHMWSCVNTRCFYYVAPRAKAPDDPNEAMALVPFLDLFNHSTVSEGAIVKHDKKGFHVRADRQYQAGEEVFVQYGRHSNDSLWSEYGFLLDRNEHDNLNIDFLVVPSLTKTQKELFDRKGYLGEYTLREDGTCYRTEVIAWLVSGALGQHNWERMTNGMFDPASMPRKAYEFNRLKMKRQIIDWIMLVRDECASNGVELRNIGANSATVLKTFVPSLDLFEKKEIEDKRGLERIARERHSMCFNRWRQIYELCMKAARAIETECQGAYLTGAKDRDSKSLNLAWEVFLSTRQR